MQIAQVHDTRRGWILFKRPHLWAIADKENIPHSPSATSEVMIALLNANNIAPEKYAYCLQPDFLHGNGSTVVQNPFPKERKVEDLPTIEDLQKQIAELTAAQSNQIIQQSVDIKTEEIKEEMDKHIKTYSDMKFFELKRLCKEREIKTLRTDKMPVLIQKLEESDGNLT